MKSKKKILVRLKKTPETDRILKRIKEKHNLTKDEEAIEKACEWYQKEFL